MLFVSLRGVNYGSVIFLAIKSFFRIERKEMENAVLLCWRSGPIQYEIFLENDSAAISFAKVTMARWCHLGVKSKKLEPRPD